ncbi:MAG: hypothetical protein IJB71_03550 [Bacilli bacterium]|nr:hypothetical protein [Bacilli bacterium]
MKKIITCLLLVLSLLIVTGCKDDKLKWAEETYFDDLPVPCEKIDKMTKSKKTDEYSEYSVYVNDYSYQEFYEYIKSLEEEGFNYEFYETSVPKEESDLNDKTETSWGANNGKIWIRALWRNEENTYYNGYNLQLIFNNYDYLKPVAKTEE